MQTVAHSRSFSYYSTLELKHYNGPEVWVMITIFSPPPLHSTYTEVKAPTALVADSSESFRSWALRIVSWIVGEWKFCFVVSASPDWSQRISKCWLELNEEWFEACLGRVKKIVRCETECPHVGDLSLGDDWWHSLNFEGWFTLLIAEHITQISDADLFQQNLNWSSQIQE